MAFGDGIGSFGQGPSGGGRGGFGKSRGRGRMYQGWPVSPNQPRQNFTQPVLKEQELEMLKQQSQQLKQQLDMVLKRIDELAKKSILPKFPYGNLNEEDKQEPSKSTALKAIIDEIKCTGCGVCVNVCPQRAITVNDIAGVDAALCTGCGECVRACPNKAIFLRKV